MFLLDDALNQPQLTFKIISEFDLVGFNRLKTMLLTH